ncbi:MAG: transaldolase [Beijerinckiaceae bacterium]
MTTKRAQLAAMTTLVADTGDLEAVRRLKPVDCTTNPTLVLKACELPASGPVIEEALAWGAKQAGTHEARTKAVCDRLAVSFGAELAKIVPGRVSTEVDADLSFDTAATVSKARAIVADYQTRGVGREKILIKIAATWEGIKAAELLQRNGIDCNLTLLFSMAQALAAADAKAFLISPFVGRILDWHVKAGGGPYDAETDPGVLSVRAIYNAYKANGIKTVVMGASFRNAGEIEALAGCDRLTISPALLDALEADTGPLPRKLDASTVAPAKDKRVPLTEAAFRWQLNQDAMATEKLSEGIRAFNNDLVVLRKTIGARLSQAA